MTDENALRTAAPSPDQVMDGMLVVMVQAGDRLALDRLARRWWPRLARAAQRIVGRDAAEDAAQEALLSILHGVGGLRDPDRFAPWAFGILRRRCVDHLRKRPQLHPGQTVTTDNEAAPGAPLERLAIAQAMAGLPEDQRFAAHLFFVEGLTLAEIAEAQGVPLGTAKSRLFHARRQLKAVLSQHLDGDDQ